MFLCLRVMYIHMNVNYVRTGELNYDNVFKQTFVFLEQHKFDHIKIRIL